MTEYASMTGACPHCGNPVEVEQAWESGGMNDYGGFILECLKCSKPFDFHIGRDIGMSRVTKGAKRLRSYDDEVDGSRERALQQFGIEREGGA